MILAVFCVTIMSVQAKLVGIEYHAVQITFARAMVVIILLLPLIYKLGGIKFLKTNKDFQILYALGLTYLTLKNYLEAENFYIKLIYIIR